MKSVNESVQTINLDRDQILILDGGRDGCMRVLHGAHWLSPEGGKRQPAWAAAPGIGPVASAPMMAARAERSQPVLPSVVRAVERVLHALASLQRVIRRQVTRLQFGPPAIQTGSC